jgi:hypothetical protein
MSFVSSTLVAGSIIARLVGDAYVHGLMSGEALSLDNREPDQDFITG